MMMSSAIDQPTGMSNVDVNINSDECGRRVREGINSDLYDRQWFNYRFEQVACNSSGLNKGGVRAPVVEHPSLRIESIGVGQTDPCTVDTFNDLRADPASITRDRCRVSLSTRTFSDAPSLKPGGKPDDYNRLIPDDSLLTGSAESGLSCFSNKQIHEIDWRDFQPLVPTLKEELSKSTTFVEEFTRGGVPTRRTEQYETKSQLQC